MITKEQYDKIKDWDIINAGTLELVEYIESIWKHESGNFKAFDVDEILYIEMHTNCYSQNDLIIQALRQNLLFFPLHWQKSERGGHYYFEINKKYLEG